jgi:hypothetical protein
MNFTQNLVTALGASIPLQVQEGYNSLGRAAHGEVAPFVRSFVQCATKPGTMVRMNMKNHGIIRDCFVSASENAAKKAVKKTVQEVIVDPYSIKISKPKKSKSKVSKHIVKK